MILVVRSVAAYANEPLTRVTHLHSTAVFTAHGLYCPFPTGDFVLGVASVLLLDGAAWPEFVLLPIP